MRTSYQLLLICLITLIFWSFQWAQAEPHYFAKYTRFITCFSPNGQCEQKLVHLIRNAQQSIYTQTYSFTSKKIATALVQAHQRGVTVNVITDRSSFDPKNVHSRIYSLIHAGIPVWVDDTVSIQHNKIMVIDQHWVETGSYNFTVSANRHNAENMLMINSPSLAAHYLTNWREQHLIATPANRYHYQPYHRHR